MATEASNGPVPPPAPGTLYVVATPIGNLSDISVRALDTLRAADLVAAEDTRHTGRLLRHFGVRASLVALHEHNEARVAEDLVSRLETGLSIAVVSDAGTPLVSDPGQRLVARARRAGIPVVPIPGPSAVLAALSVSGLPADRFLFEGFLPARAGQRRARLSSMTAEPRTLVFFEAPHRVAESLRDMAHVLGAERPACVARELTKAFEETRTDALGALAAWLEADPSRARGEFVVVVGGAPADAPADLGQEGERWLGALLKELPAARAAAVVARVTGVPRAAAYQRALTLADDREP